MNSTIKLIPEYLQQLKRWHLIKVAVVVTLAFICATNVNSQSIPGKPCYSVAIDANNNVDLYELDPATSVWQNVGNTSRSAIQSIAIDPTDATIYAVDGGELGTLNSATGVFTAIGNIGNGNGETGQVAMNNIYGLTYSDAEDVLYATQRTLEWENDLLIKINPNTGALIGAGFVDGSGNAADYALIQSVFSAANDVYDVQDIAFHPGTGDLYVQHGTTRAIFSTIDPQTGNLTNIIYEFVESIGGFGYDDLGGLYAAQSVDVNDASTSGLFNVDLLNGDHTNQNTMHPNQDPSVSFLCFDCVKNTAPVNQPIPDKACYSVAIDANNNVDLYEMDPATFTWRNVGNTGRSAIQSIAINPFDATIYAVDGGELGILSPVTGAFTSIGNIGSGNGENGQVAMNNIYGLTYSYTENVLYATQRLSGFEQNDLLIKIYPSNGTLINAGFVDGFGNSADYALIQTVYNSSKFSEEYDVQDIAFFPETNDLYALHGSPGVFTTIDTESGHLTNVIYDVFESIGGFGYDFSGNLFAAESVNVNDASFSKLFMVDLLSGSYSSQNSIHPNQNPSVSFLCFDCVKERDICPANLVQSGTIAEGTYIVSDFIVSFGTVGPSQSVTYDAGNYVLLDHGFIADSDINAYLLAEIGGCTQLRQGGGSSFIEQQTASIKNFPNPFTGETTISYNLAKATNVSLFVADITGKKIATLLDGVNTETGTHQVTFNGQHLAQGVYYCSLIAGDKVTTHKMMIVK